MSWVKGFGAVGDGKADDTAAIEHALKDGDGLLQFPRGKYRISRTIEISLSAHGRLGIEGACGTATIIMAGAGPTFRIVGSHRGTGDPLSVRPAVWNQRMPTIRNIEIVGRHPEADGIELIETMQAVLEGVLIRQVRHGIRLHKRNRNVLISHCHIYHNTGVGVFLDQVNLHQINIASSHISYNRLGGIRIEGSEVRNLQITGNDIEYNNFRAHKTPPTPTAEIYIDARADTASVNEVTIASNTIQATDSPGGANIRILESRDKSRPPGLISITGNVIGSQEHNVHLSGCYGVVLTGNTIYSCMKRNLLLEQCSQISLSGNHFRRHTPKYGTGVRIVDCSDIVLSGSVFCDESEAGQQNGASLLELDSCERITVSACHFQGGVPYGIDLANCSDILLNAVSIDESREKAAAKGSLRASGKGSGNQISGSRLYREPELSGESGF
ncbi:MAG: hypothetical protein ACI8W8_002892 [Rhodothermales bacterium]|jgi:hypothetical protein